MWAHAETTFPFSNGNQMAGVKGKSGGVRKGAGRKVAPKPPPTPVVPNSEGEPLAFLLGVMQGRIECNHAQLRAAIAAAQYVHMKKGDGGKRDEQAEKAKKVGGGKFAAAAPPLALVRR